MEGFDTVSELLSMTKLLDLPDVIVERYDGSYGKNRFSLTLTNEPTECPYCGCTKLHFNDMRGQDVTDLPILNKPTKLHLYKKRFRCTNPECRKTVYLRPSFLDADSKITNRLANAINQEAESMPFKEIAERYNLSTTTVRNQFIEYIKPLNNRELIAPRVLGIDEMYIGKKEDGKYKIICIISDIEKRQVIEVLPDRELVSVIRFLQTLKSPENVKVYTMDMHKNYQRACEHVFPNASVVVDKFHVIKWVNESLEDVRKGVRIKTKKQGKSLKKQRGLLRKKRELLTKEEIAMVTDWFSVSEELEYAYWTNKQFDRVYASTDIETAKTCLFEWIYATLDSGLKPIEKAVQTIARWRDEILNFFEYPFTNAFVEGNNRYIRTLIDKGFGFQNFEVLRGKIIMSSIRSSISKHEAIFEYEKTMYLIAQYMVTSDVNLPINISEDLLEQIICEKQEWLMANKKLRFGKLVDKFN